MTHSEKASAGEQRRRPAQGKKKRQRRSRRRRLARALVVASTSLIVALLAAWIWLESAGGQDWARRWLEDRSSALLQRQVRIATLDWDLVPFRARLGDLEIAGAEGADQPLARIAAVELRVWPWALLSRELRLQSVEVQSPLVHWDAGGGSNLVLEARGGGGLAVSVAHLTVADGAIEINHRRWNLDSSLSGMSLDLQAVETAAGARRRAGTLRVGGGGLTIAVPEGAANAATGTLELVAAEVPFTVDASELTIEPARLALGNSELSASGTISDWERGDLTVAGRIDVRDAIGLGGITLADTDAGTITLDATLTWGTEPLRFAGSLSAPSITLAGVEATDLTASVLAGSERLEVDNLSMGLFSGIVSATLAADLTSTPRRWTLIYDATDVDLNALSRSPALPGFRFAGIAGASGELDWTDPLRDTITGSGTFDLNLPSGTLERASEREAEVADATAAPGGAAPGADAPTPAPALQRVAPSLPLPLTAHADFVVEAGTLTVRNATASLPNTVASITGTVGRDRRLGATVRLESGDLRMLDRFFNQIRRFRGEQPVPRPFGLAGSGLVSVALAGTLDDPTLDGTLEARGLSVADNDIGDVDGGLRLAGASLEVIDLRLRRDGGSGEGEGQFRIGQRLSTGPDYSFGLRLQGFPMQADLPRLGTPLAASGRTSGEVSLTGSYGGPPVGLVTLSAEDVRLNQLEGLSAELRVRLDAQEWVAERFEISGPRGRITVTGSWLRADDTVQAQLDAVGLDAAAVNDMLGADIPLAGTLQLQALLTGPFSAPDAAATLRWTEAGLYGVTLGAVAMSTELRGGAIAVSAVGRSDPEAPAVPPPTPLAQGGDVAIALDTVPQGGWAATLSADLAAPRHASVRAAGASDLALAFLAAQGYESGDDVVVSGTVEANGNGVLGEWQAWQGDAVLSDFVLTRPDLSFAIPEPLRLDLGGGRLRVDLPELRSEAGSLQANGVIDLATGSWVEARSSGLLSLAVLGALSDELTSDGTLEVDLEATGEVLAGDVAGSFELYDVSFAHTDSPWSASELNGTIFLSDNTLDLRDVRGLVSERPFSIDGTLPLAALAGDESAAPVSLDLVIDALPLEPLWQKTGPVQELITGGQAAVTASVRGRGTDWRAYEGRIEVRALRVNLTDLALTMPQPTTITLSGDRLAIDDVITLQGPGTDLRVSGAFLLAPFRFDARLQGTTALDPFNAVTRGWGVAGRAEVDVQVVGDPPRLGFDGTMRVSSGLLNTPIVQPIENISADLTLQDRLVRIDRFAGSLGSTGANRSNVSITGELQLVESVPRSFVLELGVDEAELRIQRGIRLTSSADLVIEGTFERSILSGRMDVSNGEYTQRWDNEETVMAMSETRVAGVDHPLAQTVALDIDVIAPGELRIVNNMADVELSADLQVRGTLANPVILGSATVLDGDVTYRDQRYRFLRGSLDFQNPLRTEPNFDIALETSIRQYLVTLNASGSPARGDINATFVSSPPLSDLQLIQLLTVGNAPDEDVRSDNETLSAVGTQAASFLTRQYLSQVERGAQQVFGIDRFSVEPAVTSGSGDPTARVTVGKQVTPDLWVSWTSVLGTTEEQLVTLEYQLTRGIRLRAMREEDGSYGVDIRFDHRIR